MISPSLEIPILSPSALTQVIKTLLEGQFRFVCVQGEISNCKLQTSGHLYFSLKDAEAQIAAVMFKMDASLLPRLPKDGDQVIVKGALNVYPPSGKYQIVARNLEFAGLGALLLKLEELKIKLKKLGFFDQRHKKPLPKYPERIGVVTSPTGAVIQDILHVLSRRFSGFQLILNPVKVQGEGAASEIAAAIDFFNQHEMVDVMIVGRGGGSIEDLFAFNEEIVAKSIFRSKIPIISAVGHETDHCIADYVADVRAPTPSAAAEMVIAEKAHTLVSLENSKKRLQQTVFHLIRHDREKLQRIQKHPLFSSPYAILGSKMQRLDDFRNFFDQKIAEMISKHILRLNGLQKQNEALRPSNRIAHVREKLQYLEKSLGRTLLKKWQQKKQQLEHMVLVLKTLDPKNILKKGFSIILSEDNSVIKSTRSLHRGDSVKLLFSDGEAHSIIKEIKSRE